MSGSGANSGPQTRRQSTGTDTDVTEFGPGSCYRNVLVDSKKWIYENMYFALQMFVAWCS